MEVMFVLIVFNIWAMIIMGTDIMMYLIPTIARDISHIAVIALSIVIICVGCKSHQAIFSTIYTVIYISYYAIKTTLVEMNSTV